jgi:hypothetical protein
VSNLAAALTVLATLTVGMPAAYWRIRRAARADSERDRIVAEAEAVARGEWVYTGPDSLRLLEDLDTHLDAYHAQLAHLFEELGPPPAELKARHVIPEQREDGQS